MKSSRQEKGTASVLSHVCSFKNHLALSISLHLQGEKHSIVRFVDSREFAELPAKILQGFGAELAQNMRLLVHTKHVQNQSGEMGAKQLEGWKPSDPGPMVLLALDFFFFIVIFLSCFKPAANTKSV